MPSQPAAPRLPLPRRSTFCILLLSFLSLSCRSGQDVTYVVGLAEPDSLTVRIEIEGAPRDSLLLRSYASTEILRLSDLRVTGPDGGPLRARLGVRAVQTASQAADVAHVLIPGPVPDRLQIEYRIAPSLREGNEHTGFSGKSFGELNGRFGLVAGRNIFLIPQGDRPGRVTVRFTLPEGWAAATSFPGEAPSRPDGVRGKHALESLIGSAIGLGRFRERHVQVGRTRYCFSFESGIPKDEEDRAMGRLERVARYVQHVFGRDLGGTYRTIVVPSTLQGDEIEGGGWADGQGGTFVPLTTARLRRFAGRLLEAYLVHPPYRSEVRHPQEYWVVDGIRNLYAWRAVANAGLMRDDDVTSETVAAYVQTLDAKGVERDLERLYGSEENTQIGRDYTAPAALLCLDQLIRAETSDTECLDNVVRRMFRGRNAAEISTALPKASRSRWESFRIRFVRGAEPLDVRGLSKLRAARPSPDAPSGEPVRELTVVYTGDTHGFLENCGCKVNQAGGVSRRATILNRIRREDPGAVLIDAGNAFAEPVGEQNPTYLSKREQELYLRTMDLVRYDAAVICRTELLLGLDHFKNMMRGIRTPFLAANVNHGDSSIAAPARIIRRGDLDIAVIGVLEPPRGRAAGLRFEQNVTGLSFGDPVETLKRNARALRSRVDLIVAVGGITPATVRQIEAGCPEVDVVISSSTNAPTLIEAEGRQQMALRDVSGFIGRMLVLYTSLQQYGLQVARLSLDGEGRVVSAKIEEQRLHDRIPDDPRMRRVLNDFYDEVGKVEASQGSVARPFAWDSSRLDGEYVGAARCLPCHEDEHRQWQSTQHAVAFKTLLDRHRHFQPQCISCHVVGYGARHGFRVGAPEEPLGNVQCEVCHGPGGNHVRRPAASNIQGAVPERVCLECHNPAHSDAFSYAKEVSLVDHSRAN